MITILLSSADDLDVEVKLNSKGIATKNDLKIEYNDADKVLTIKPLKGMNLCFLIRINLCL